MDLLTLIYIIVRILLIILELVSIGIVVTAAYYRHQNTTESRKRADYLYQKVLVPIIITSILLFVSFLILRSFVQTDRERNKPGVSQFNSLMNIIGDLYFI